MGDETPMPPDPFSAAGQPDVSAWTAGLHAFYMGLQASGFPEPRAFGLTDTFLRMQMMGAAAVQQQEPGDV
jgi:hypothetical protein